MSRSRQLSKLASVYDAGGPLGYRNRIINGDMRIDQRNAGASVTGNDGVYTLDRWRCWASQSSKFTVQQNAGSVTPPAGLTNYLGITSSSAYTVGASEYFGIAQYIEGLNVADLAWGTANAKTVTLSFQVYSSLTGTFGGAINNSAFNRSYPFSYSVPVANTWTTVTVTIPGDTSGTWLKTNGIGISVVFGLGMGASVSGTAGSWAGAGYYSATGATSVVGTNGATFYITGVQLEVGSTATSFDIRDYGRELILCQRYFAQSYVKFAGYSAAYAQTIGGWNTFHTSMRATPTLSYSNISYNNSSGLGVDTVTLDGFTSSGTVSATGAYVVGFNYAASAEL